MVKSFGVQSPHLEVFAAEFIGTAVLVGLSPHSNVWLWQPDRARRAERGVAILILAIAARGAHVQLIERPHTPKDANSGVLEKRQ